MRSALRLVRSAAILSALLAAGLPAAAQAPAAEDPAANLAFAPGLDEAEPQEPTPAFARVRYAEGELRVVREAGYDEQAPVNAPVYAGDDVLTDRGERGELQLPEGTLVRLDGGTRVEIYDLAEPDGSARSILGLAQGTVQAEVAHARGGDAFRLDTRSASIYPLERSSVRVDLQRGEEVVITVARGRVEVAGADGSVLVTTGERTRVRPGRAPVRPWDYLLASGDEFDRWVSTRDERLALRERPGKEYEQLPEPVRPYYGELREHGEWVWTDPYGWVWNPDVEDDWRPYARGSWYPGPHGPVWTSPEPWSWPVYRYGRWDWRTSIGWVWIPGRVFRPAHVVWYYGPSYVGWCPVGYYDWPVHLSISFGWGHPWFDHRPWVFVDYDRFFYHRHVFRHAGGIRPRLSDGVVTRRAVRVNPRHVVRGAKERSRAAVARRASTELRERARHLSARRSAAAVRVADIDARRGDERQRAAAQVRRVPFTEREQRVLARREAPSERGRAGAADRSREIRRRAPAGRPDGGSRVSPGSSPRARDRDSGSSGGRSGGVRPRSGGARGGRSSAGGGAENRRRRSPQVSIRPEARSSEPLRERGRQPVGRAGAGEDDTGERNRRGVVRSFGSRPETRGTVRSFGRRSEERRAGEERVRRFFRQLDDTRRSPRPRTGTVRGGSGGDRGPAVRGTRPGARDGSSTRIAPRRSSPSRSLPRYRVPTRSGADRPSAGPSRSLPRRPSSARPSRGSSQRPSAGSTQRRSSSRSQAGSSSRSAPTRRVAPSRSSGSRSKAGAASRSSSGSSRSKGRARRGGK